MKIICPICGDVTNGHPAMDKLCADLLQGGFTTKYTQELIDEKIQQEINEGN